MIAIEEELNELSISIMHHESQLAMLEDEQTRLQNEYWDLEDDLAEQNHDPS